jgi:hypothetical protein
MDALNLIQARIDAEEELLEMHVEDNTHEMVKGTDFGKVEFGLPCSNPKKPTFANAVKDHDGQLSFKYLAEKFNQFWLKMRTFNIQLARKLISFSHILV